MARDSRELHHGVAAWRLDEKRRIDGEFQDRREDSVALPDRFGAQALGHKLRYPRLDFRGTQATYGPVLEAGQYVGSHVAVIRGLGRVSEVDAGIKTLAG